MNTQYWVGIKDLKDPLKPYIPFELAKGKTLLSAKREGTRRLNRYVPPSDLFESDPVVYIATGMNRREQEWKRIAKKPRGKKWVML